MLTVLVASWWLCAFFGASVSLFLGVFWRPEPIYNDYAFLTLFSTSVMSINVVHVSQFFITLERIIVMRSTTLNYNHKVLLILCILTNLGLCTFLGVTFVTHFHPSHDNSGVRMPVLRILEEQAYLIQYYTSYGISLITLVCSFCFILLFRKTITAKTEKSFTKMQNTIKYTILVDIWLDFLPQILTIGLSLFGSTYGPYVATLQRILFTFCGIFVNQRFHKNFVVNRNSTIANSSMKTPTIVNSKL
uniref:7TM_GPCR_Srx domain-containing protein n=1 Tax=Panagrellus redivivus TaxID=6233 RepID=A0A7E4VZ82_PANRE